MGATFEDIQKINKSIVTMDVKGKDYAPVNQRIKAFRMLYPNGFITTEMLSHENNVCVFKASVGYIENLDRIILGTGTACEQQGTSNVNKTSYVENCETSAVGRALGMAGIGIDTSVASYEEVLNAIEEQNKPDKIDQKKQEVKTKQAELQSKIKMIKKYIKKEELMQKYMEYITSNKIHSEKDITEQHADALIKLLGESK